MVWLFFGALSLIIVTCLIGLAIEGVKYLKKREEVLASYPQPTIVQKSPVEQIAELKSNTKHGVIGTIVSIPFFWFICFFVGNPSDKILRMTLWLSLISLWSIGRNLKKIESLQKLHKEELSQNKNSAT